MGMLKKYWFEIYWPFIVVSAAFGALSYVTGYVLPKAKCANVAEHTGRPTQFDWLSGCYVKVNEKWIPVDSWRGEQDK